ncbi:DUF4158 domain-containing protein [Verminephrobacter aporrectodeae]|uniref:hypothetical protein n=1 Tax=Verminephrobacter aporrectodeae TaxID=1110389 RepID=UPI00224471AC|nr:hypothetical protein [Verminephrobacter aporrectodeae]
MGNKNKLLAIFSDAEQEALYGLPDFDDAHGLAAHPAERALHLPERRKDDRLGLARGRAEIGMTEISGVPAYNPGLGAAARRAKGRAMTRADVHRQRSSCQE